MRVVTIQIRVPDDVEVQINRSDEPSHLAPVEPPLFEGAPEGPIAPPMREAAPWTENRAMPGPNPICPRHHKSKERNGHYFCPTVISAPGVEPKVWCDWRVKVA